MMLYHRGHLVIYCEEFNRGAVVKSKVGKPVYEKVKDKGKFKGNKKKIKLGLTKKVG